MSADDDKDLADRLDRLERFVASTLAELRLCWPTLNERMSAIEALVDVALKAQRESGPRPFDGDPRRRDLQ
jgi:hypothetical protein